MLKNLRNSEEFEQLAQLIRERAAGKKIVFAPSAGNWGDALILKGTLQFLRNKQIPFEILTRDKLDRIKDVLAPADLGLKDAVLISCGGGSWCKNFHGNRDFVNRIESLFDHVIVFPSTYELPALNLPSGKITYVARDIYNSLATIPGSIFCHDMAFYLELPEPFNTTEIQETGYFLREDNERSAAARTLGEGYDISLLGNHNSRITPFFKILGNYANIETDRMHVAIAGAMLGKNVKLYSSDYFKGPDVFKSSIALNYPTVTLSSW